MDLEELAIALGNNPCLLRKRLNEARQVLLTEFSDLLETPTFDLQDRCLYGRGYRLEWRVRRHPELPIGPDNQQKSAGVVILRKEM